MNSFSSPWNKNLFHNVGKQFIEMVKEDDRYLLINRVVSEILESTAFVVNKFSPSEACRILCCKSVRLSLIVGLFLMNDFIVAFGTGYRFGLAAIFQALYNQENGDADETLFPVYVACISTHYSLGQMQDFTGQCYLAVNKWFLIVFLFHTALFFALSLIVFIDIAVTIFSFSKCSRVNKIHRWLKSKKVDIKDYGGTRALLEFVSSIGIDFMVMMSILESSSGERLVSEVMEKLWKKYQVVLREKLAAKMV